MKIGVVVLNYKNYNETISCVRSILRQEGVDIHIAVVDNGSNNNSICRIKETFEQFDNISIIESKENLGYARGNNIGIAELRKKDISFIFVANSDLFFDTNTILKQLVEEYEEGVGLIAPVIRNLDGSIEQRVAYKKDYLYLRIIKKIISGITGISFRDKPATVDGSIEYSKKLTGLLLDRYVVTGSGFLLTKDFFEFYQGLYPKTFLYYEEWATILLLHKSKLKTKIVNGGKLIHKGGESTPDEIKQISKTRKKIMNDSACSVLRLLFTPACFAKKWY